MPDDLDARLARLAPDVDPAAARAAVRSRARAGDRRRLALLGTACTGLLVLGVLAAVADGGDGDEVATVDDPDVSTTTTADPESTTTSGSDTTATTSTTSATTSTSTTPTTVPASVPGPATATTTTDDGVQLTVTAERDTVVAGERLWLDVTVRNVGSEPFSWMSGGCRIPATAWMSPAGGGTDGDPTHGPGNAGWNGDPAGLSAWVAEHNTLGTTLGAAPERFTAWRGIACPMDFGLTAVAPGDEVRHRASVEVRPLPGPLLSDGAYVVSASFQPYRTGGDPNAPGYDVVVVSAPITVTDDPARAADPDAAAAVDAFVADPRLGQWLDSTLLPEQPELTQTWHAELSWWRGAWELWLAPDWGGNGELRMRYDPTATGVVDVRVVPQGRPADDEPDATHHPNDGAADADTVL